MIVSKNIPDKFRNKTEADLHMNFGRIKSFNTEGSRVEITFENAVGYITAVTEDIINVFCPFKPECNHSFAIEGDKSKNVRVIANMVGNYMVISTSKLAIYVYDNFLIKFVQSDGTVICFPWSRIPHKARSLDL